jgi:hypothetical protein
MMLLRPMLPLKLCNKLLVEDVVFRFPCIVLTAIVLPFYMIKHIAFFVESLSDDTLCYEEVVVELFFWDNLSVVSVPVDT